MRELIRELLSRCAAGGSLVYCRVLETRGSTPQKAGAAMLVYPDGSQSGTLGGGCIEAEVKRRALHLLGDGEATVMRFDLDKDYGWDDGLICGGRMQVLVEPLRDAAATAWFETLGRLIESGAGCTEAMVFDAEKSGLALGGSYLFDEHGRPVAHCRGQDSPPSSVADGLVPLEQRPRPSASHGVAYLPVLPRCRLLIVGGGHVGQAVANLAYDLEFDVWVVDDRDEYVSRERFLRAERLIQGKIGEVLRDIEVTPSTYCLIVTRGHNHDEEALFHLAEKPVRYVGMIGSKRKIRLIFDDLEAEGIDREAISRVYAPVGIDIGSQTVPEIAVSILAELIAHRNLAGQVPARGPSLLEEDAVT